MRMSSSINHKAILWLAIHLVIFLVSILFRYYVLKKVLMLKFYLDKIFY